MKYLVILIGIFFISNASSQVVVDSASVEITNEKALFKVKKQWYNSTINQNKRIEEQLKVIIEAENKNEEQQTIEEVNINVYKSEPKEAFQDSDGDGTADNYDFLYEDRVLDKMISETESESEYESESEQEKKSKRLRGPSQFDSRIELMQLNPLIPEQFMIYQKSQSVAMIIEKEKLNQITKDIYSIDISQKLGTTYSLCPDEAFYNQPIVGAGTAFIFSENSMLTAKHVFERPLSDYVIVFGYQVEQANGVVETLYDASNLYYPKEITFSDTDLDAVVFTVDRDFDRPVLEWEDSSLLSNKQPEIYMIGHPLGLPLKVAVNAGIEDQSHTLYYYTSLDSFQGNSGSPVFNFTTNKVIGILVSGEIDYKFNGNCYYSPSCKIPYCKGEKVIRIEQIVKQF